jgi:hypothetical protein
MYLLRSRKEVGRDDGGKGAASGGWGSVTPDEGCGRHSAIMISWWTAAVGGGAVSEEARFIEGSSSNFRKSLTVYEMLQQKKFVQKV